MNPIVNAIQSEGLSGTAAEISPAFGADVTIATDSTAYTWSGMNEKLSENGVDALTIAGLDIAIGSWTGGTMLDKMLSSGGVNFAKPDIRYMLSAAAQAAPHHAAIIAAMLAIGVTTGPRWQRAGLQSLPTEQQIQEALNTIEAQQKFAQFANETLPQMITAGTTWAAVKAAFAEIG